MSDFTMPNDEETIRSLSSLETEQSRGSPSGASENSSVSARLTRGSDSVNYPRPSSLVSPIAPATGCVIEVATLEEWRRLLGELKSDPSNSSIVVTIYLTYKYFPY